MKDKETIIAETLEGLAAIFGEHSLAQAQFNQYKELLASLYDFIIKKDDQICEGVFEYTLKLLQLYKNNPADDTTYVLITACTIAVKYYHDRSIWHEDISKHLQQTGLDFNFREINKYELKLLNGISFNLPVPETSTEKTTLLRNLKRLYKLTNEISAIKRPYFWAHWKKQNPPTKDRLQIVKILEHIEKIALRVIKQPDDQFDDIFFQNFLAAQIFMLLRNLRQYMQQYKGKINVGKFRNVVDYLKIVVTTFKHNVEAHAPLSNNELTFN